MEGERPREPARAAGHPRARHAPSRGAPHSQVSDCLIRDRSNHGICVYHHLSPSYSAFYHHDAAVRHARARGAHNFSCIFRERQSPDWRSYSDPRHSRVCSRGKHPPHSPPLLVRARHAPSRGAPHSHVSDCLIRDRSNHGFACATTCPRVTRSILSPCRCGAPREGAWSAQFSGCIFWERQSPDWRSLQTDADQEIDAPK